MKIKIVSYIFVFVGAALLIVGYFMFQAKATFISESEVVDGVVIVTLFGIVFFLVGMGIIVGRINRQKKRRRLLATGRKIQTKFSEVEKSINISVNRKNPYRIITQYNEGNELFVFQSENIWFDPSSFIQEDQTIVVYVSRDKMNDYYMDVSFLPSPVS